MKILTVEDDPVAQLLLESALKYLGHEPVLATDGESAWAALRDRTVRLVVSDWLMPGMDGLELCRRIRARSGEYVYFILLTQQSANEENQNAAVEAGVDDFLTKPVNPRELRMRLRVAERILGYTQQVSQLESFLPICSYCKSVRSDQDYWQQIESYMHTHSGTKFSHGVCPQCVEIHVRPMLRAAGIDDTALSLNAPSP
jgi:sigma-B regulation protein RsbU (phosphoserine phosphatase)